MPSSGRGVVVFFSTFMPSSNTTTQTSGTKEHSASQTLHGIFDCLWPLLNIASQVACYRMEKGPRPEMGKNGRRQGELPMARIGGKKWPENCKMESGASFHSFGILGPISFSHVWLSASFHFQQFSPFSAWAHLPFDARPPDVQGGHKDPARTKLMNVQIPAQNCGTILNRNTKTPQQDSATAFLYSWDGGICILVRKSQGFQKALGVEIHFGKCHLQHVSLKFLGGVSETIRHPTDFHRFATELPVVPREVTWNAMEVPVRFSALFWRLEDSGRRKFLKGG